jgi:hypothetical protein
VAVRRAAEVGLRQGSHTSSGMKIHPRLLRSESLIAERFGFTHLAVGLMEAWGPVPS